MHPTLAQVLVSLEQSRGRLRAAIDTVPVELRAQPPGSDRWSVAAVLEHLSLVDERVAGIIGNKIEEARAAGTGPEEEHPALLPPNIEAMLVDRGARRPAPEGLHPSGLAYDAAVARLDAARASLRDRLSAGDGLALSRVIYEHHRFGALNPYQWAGFVAAHESRHAEQIKEIAAQLAPAADASRAR